MESVLRDHCWKAVKTQKLKEEAKEKGYLCTGYRQKKI